MNYLDYVRFQELEKLLAPYDHNLERFLNSIRKEGLIERAQQIGSTKKLRTKGDVSEFFLELHRELYPTYFGISEERILQGIFETEKESILKYSTSELELSHNLLNVKNSEPEAALRTIRYIRGDYFIARSTTFSKHCYDRLIVAESIVFFVARVCELIDDVLINPKKNPFIEPNYEDLFFGEVEMKAKKSVLRGLLLRLETCPTIHGEFNRQFAIKVASGFVYNLLDQ